MVPSASAPAAFVGVAESGPRATLVTLGTRDGPASTAPAEVEALDRRDVDLIDPGMPTHPYHHEGAWAVGRYRTSPWARDITLEEAVSLIRQGHACAARRAREALEGLTRGLDRPVVAIAIRRCPALPPTIEERIADAKAQAMADGILYRRALADAGAALGWAVFEYDRGRVFEDAGAAAGAAGVEALLDVLGRALGPPWRQQHKTAAAGALCAAGMRHTGGSGNGT